MLWHPSEPSATALAQRMAHVTHLEINLEKSYGGGAPVVIAIYMAMGFSGIVALTNPTILPVAFWMGTSPEAAYLLCFDELSTGALVR